MKIITTAAVITTLSLVSVVIKNEVNLFKPNKKGLEDAAGKNNPNKGADLWKTFDN